MRCTAGLTFAAALLASANVLMSSPARADSELCEDRAGDAGSLPTSAKPATGTGLLTAINGRLGFVLPANGGPRVDQEDMYLVQIVNHEAFAAQTVVSMEGEAFDTRLWLFDGCGFGLLGNDNTPGEPESTFSTLLPFSNDGSGAVLPGPGVYHLAITATPNEPLSDAGPIFFFAQPDEVSGPDAPGGFLPIVAWQGGTAPEASYRIELAGVAFLGVQSACAADLDGNGVVEGGDLGILLASWGPCTDACPLDLNGDGAVDGGDLGIVLSSWGPCPPPFGTPCGDPAAGACTDANGLPGCADPCCCTLVCQLEPVCCDLGWDQLCADLAASTCP